MINKNSLKVFPVLETDKILIRQMLKTDNSVVYDFNSCEESLKYIVREPFKTMEEADQKLSFFLSGNEDKSACWWVFTLKETGEDIGYGGLFDISADHSRAEIGYGLIKKYWGKGYMSEIIQAILKFGFQDLQLHKIYGVVIPGNVASVQVLEKNNFVKEAHLKEHSFARGQYFDESIYSLVKT